MARTTTTTEDAVIIGVEHASTSGMGNPTYRLVLADGRTVLTETNGSIGYAATNYRPRYGSDGTPVVLMLTRAGRVRSIEARA